MGIDWTLVKYALLYQYFKILNFKEDPRYMIKTLRFLIFLFLLNTGSQTVFAQVTNLNTPPGSGQFGNSVTVLLNGNYVVTDPYWDQDGIADVGAVYLYDGKTHALISILTGSLPNDNVGLGGVTALSNGHFLVRSYLWNNESTEDVGAVTWGSGVTGMNGVVNSNNSLVGSTKYDRVGNGGVVELTNGNFVVMSSSWQNTSLSQSGAITWGNGHTGIVGIVSSANSLTENTSILFKK